MKNKKVKKRQKPFVVPIEAFNTEVLIILGGKRSEAHITFSKTIKKNPLQGPELSELDVGSSMASTFINDSFMGSCIWFQSLKPTPGVIAHEALHALAHMHRIQQTPLTPDTEECWAYPLQYLVDKIFEATRKPFVI